MKRVSRALVALPVGALFLLLATLPTRATVIVTSQISFDGLTITPTSGSAQFETNWQASAFAQAGANSQMNSGSSPSASATGDFSFAQSAAFAPMAQAFNVSGSASASNGIIGNLNASDQASAHATVWEDQFEITGGSGSVSTMFSMNIGGLLTAFTDATGQSAEVEGKFTLQLDGTPILFNDQLLSIGPNNTASEPLSTTLSASTTLQYNTVYQLFIEGDANATALNGVPEPSVGALAMMGGLTALFLRRKRNGP